LEDLTAAVTRFFTDPAARRDAVPLYRRLVAEAPVLKLGPMWVVSGHTEITKLARHPEALVNPSVRGVDVPLSPLPTLSMLLGRMLAVRDGDDHRRLKRLAVATFSAARITAARGTIEDAVDELLDPALAAGTFDVVADLAVPLPVAISCALLDVPASDRGRVLAWSTVFSSSYMRFRLSDDEYRELEERVGELLAYIDELCELRRREPGDDLVSELVRAADRGEIEEDELTAFVLMLFANGLETLTSGISVAVWQLLQEPAQLERLRREPELAEAMFEECLRLGSPVRSSARAITADIELGGEVLRRGDVAALFYAAGNRDPRVFADPDRLDPDRANGRQLAFGHGAHFCLGASLSLGAGKIVLQRLAERCHNLSTPLTPETARWNDSLVFNGLESLPVTFDPVAAPLAAATS
jgi:cytochrome P450